MTQPEIKHILMPIAPSNPSWKRARDHQKQQQQLRDSKESELLEASLTREWKPGDLYAPHDLSAVEMRKWKKRHAPPTDAFDALNIKPLDIYKVCWGWVECPVEPS